jgi:hypothetical protein
LSIFDLSVFLPICASCIANITITGSIQLGMTHFSRQNSCRCRNYCKRTARRIR